MFVSDRATMPYPASLHAVEIAGPDGETTREVQVADVQIHPGDTTITIVNASPVSYEPATVWVNQRYALTLDRLAAGETTTVSLWEFFDQWGQRYPAGGFWRTVDPVPVLLVEIQTAADTPMVNAVTVTELRENE